MSSYLSCLEEQTMKHYEAMSAAPHLNATIRSLSPQEAQRVIAHADSAHLTPVFTYHPSVSQEQRVRLRYAGAFHRTAQGRAIGVVCWDAEACVLHFLSSSPARPHLAAILADHAISNMSPPQASAHSGGSSIVVGSSVPVGASSSSAKGGFGGVHVQGCLVETHHADFMTVIKEWLRDRRPGTAMEVSAYRSLLEKGRANMKMIEQHHERAVKRAHDVLNLRLRYTYEPKLAGEERERQAELRVYLSTDVSTQVCILPPNRDLQKEVTLGFRLRSGAITSDCILNLDAYARYRNEDGTMCVNQAGYSNSLLSSMLGGQLFATSLTVRNSESSHSKGEVQLQVLSSSTERGRQFGESAAPLAEVLSRMQQDNDEVMEYARANQAFYNQYEPRVKSIERITVYLQQTRVGCVPGSLFDVFRLHKPDEEYYLNSLHIAVQRRLGASRPVNLAQRWLREADPQLRTASVMDMLCVFVTACPYITDEVDDNEVGSRWNAKLVELIESFDDVFSRNAGDCEDFARAILRLYYEILLGAAYFQSAVMREVASILDRFIVFSLLCGVSSASIRDVQSADSQLNGHEAAIALPKSVFYEALRRRQPHHPVLATASAKELSAGSTDCIYILEGTGMLRPEPSCSAPGSQQVHASVDRVRQQQQQRAGDDNLADAAVLMHYDPRAPNNFYKLMVTLITPYFFLKWGHGFVEFLLVYQKSQSCVQRGVWFTELLNLHADKRIGCEAAPMISEYVFGAFEHVSKDDYPLHSLRCTPLTAEMLDLAARATYIQPENRFGDDHAEISDAHSYSFFININRMDQRRAALIVELAKKAGLSVRSTAQPISVSPERLISGVYQCKFF